MAATGKTPILLYGSTTATNTPVAGNLTNSSDGCEIAINVADKNLFFKDSTNAVNTVPIRQSSASSNGWLSSTDWSTFNGKASTSSPTFSGNVTLSAGNLVIGTSGKGIDFSATPGTGTSELLADYEEGTWTPVVVGTTSAGTGTYTVQQAHYIKTGNVVNFTCALGWSNHTGTGNIEITGLPYSISGSQDTAPCNVFCWGLTFTGQLTAVTSGTKISPYQIATNAAATALAMDTAVAAFNISGFYFTN